MPTPDTSSIELTFLGAAGTVTGSCTLVRCGAATLLIDYGTAQGCPQAQLPIDPKSIDAVIMTHAHLDHSGMVPRLCEDGWRGRLVGHGATCDIAAVVWEDSGRMHDQGRPPPFSMASVKLAEQQCEKHGYGEPFSVAGVTITLFDAGHILGSSHVLLEYGGKKVLFSGDIGTVGTPIIRDPYTGWSAPVDAVVIESTYGDRQHKDRAATVAELRALALQTFEQRGVLLIPCFAIGRTQEILYHFNDMVESGDLPRMPVIVDSPMASRVSAIYRAHEECYDGPTRARILSGDLPLEFPGLGTAFSGGQSRMIADMRPPMVVVAGSGMCNGGRILNHLKRLLPSASTTVAMAGYQASGTLGRRLVEGAQVVDIDGEQVPVKARIATLGGLSAHADQDGLLTWARAVPGSGVRWFVNHGEPQASGALAQVLTQDGRGDVRVAERGERVVI
jgi:metallo-beta-lactamase family protein